MGDPMMWKIEAAADTAADEVHAEDRALRRYGLLAASDPVRSLELLRAERRAARR